MDDETTRDDEPRIDLVSLDPRTDHDRFETNLHRVRLAAEPELQRRRRAYGLWSALLLWRRPALTAGGVLAIAAILVLLLLHGSAPSAPGFTQILGVPEPWESWLQGEENPGPGDLLSSGRGQP